MLTIPPSLFRYRPISSKSWPDLLERELDAVKNSYLWFSSFSDLNDPMEGHIEHSIDEISAQLKPLDSSGKLNDALRPLLEMKDSMTVCSLSSSWKNGMMWSLYANEHQGICVEYTPRPIMEWMVEALPLLKVVYSETPPHIFENIKDLLSFNNPQKDEELTQKMLANKSLSWQNEYEYRFIRPYSGKFYHHKSAIKSIILGAKHDNNVRYKVLSCAKKVAIPVYETKLDGYGMERIAIYQPDQNHEPKTSSEAQLNAKAIIKQFEVSDKLTPAIEHAYMSALNDPHCIKITRVGLSCTERGRETLFCEYDCNRPHPKNPAEASRRNAMKFKLIGHKSERDWSVRLNEKRYS